MNIQNVYKKCFEMKPLRKPKCPKVSKSWAIYMAEELTINLLRIIVSLLIV